MKECPSCGLANVDSAVACDCGVHLCNVESQDPDAEIDVTFARQRRWVQIHWVTGVCAFAGTATIGLLSILGLSAWGPYLVDVGVLWILAAISGTRSGRTVFYQRNFFHNETHETSGIDGVDASLPGGAAGLAIAFVAGLVCVGIGLWMW